MMAEVIGSTLGFAVGVAISPLPIAAVILMLFSARARINSLLFATAWVVGIAAVTSAMLLLPGLSTDGGQPSSTTGWVKLGLGVLLLAAGASQWRSRRGEYDEAEVPNWMRTIDELAPGAAFGLGLLLSALNPKNLLLAAAAGATIAAADLTTGAAIGVIVVFTGLAASTVLLPTLAYLVAGQRLDPLLTRSKDWLMANNTAVMAVLFVVFGFNLVGDGIQLLSG
jgi:threonine/homoserine/homoserine lactone efflux protein